MDLKHSAVVCPLGTSKIDRQRMPCCLGLPAMQERAAAARPSGWASASNEQNLEDIQALRLKVECLSCLFHSR